MNKLEQNLQIFREFPSIEFSAAFALQFLQAFNSVECCCFLSGLAACDTAHGRGRRARRVWRDLIPVYAKAQ